MVIQTTLQQTIFKSFHKPIHVTQLNESELTESQASEFLRTTHGDVYGIAASYGPRLVLTSVAFSTSTRVLYIKMTAPRKGTKGKSKTQPAALTRSRDILRDRLLCHLDFRKLGFDAHRIAISLYLDHSLFITRAIDLQSVITSNRRAPATLLQILGGEAQLHKEQLLNTFFGIAYDKASPENVCLRAWAACQAASVGSTTKQLLSVLPIDTSALETLHLNVIAKVIRDFDRLYILKPTRVKNDVATQFSHKQGALNVELTRFKTRLRVSSSQSLVVEVASKGRQAISAQGRTTRQAGKAAQISLNKSVPANGQIKNVYTIGREELTHAESERELVALQVLQCRSAFFSKTLVRRIFVGCSGKTLQTRSAKRRAPPAPPILFPGRPLNASQTAAVRRILSKSSDDRVCLVHGPPGTGKTTVIAASVTSLMAAPADGVGIWLVAQSNVAVKNIAEKLASVGFADFKILVSKDFHFEWHEHLYQMIERNVIRSDDFADNYIGTERLLLGSKVILCTISMLSHPRLGPSGFIRLVPIHTVVVDEASQIEVGDYLPTLDKFDIQKLVFIGDDQQLAPYGQDDLGNLRSIFECDHLRNDAVFLDTQYRMPVHIGGFISRHIYDGKLQTVHSLKARSVCRLVDIQRGKEEQAGKSWINKAEAQAVVVVARGLARAGKSFRVITPYDSQRNLLEKMLKAEKLPWENKCFNVDSFQGNEDDHIVISVVRTSKVGFLSNLRRTNVMLSRCKQSMTVCTNRAFLEGVASSTLMGKLASEWGSDGWLSWQDIISGRF